VENVILWVQSLTVTFVKAFVNTVEQVVVTIVSNTVEQDAVFDLRILQTS
jgi:hypothetical protein